MRRQEAVVRHDIRGFQQFLPVAYTRTNGRELLNRCTKEETDLVICKWRKWNQRANEKKQKEWWGEGKRNKGKAKEKRETAGDKGGDSYTKSRMHAITGIQSMHAGSCAKEEGEKEPLSATFFLLPSSHCSTFLSLLLFSISSVCGLTLCLCFLLSCFFLYSSFAAFTCTP